MKRVEMKLLCAGMFCTALAGLSLAHAQPSGEPPRGRPTPPPEAFTACQGKSKGAECSVAFHGKNLDGACVLEDQSQLFCFPNDMPAPPNGGTPPSR